MKILAVKAPIIEMKRLKSLSSDLHGQVGHFSHVPVMEWTVSKATILGMAGSTIFNFSSRLAGSLCLKMDFGQPEFLIPWIIDAWLPSSEKI